jgi:hypothetical protein
VFVVSIHAWRKSTARVLHVSNIKKMMGHTLVVLVELSMVETGMVMTTEDDKLVEDEDEEEDPEVLEVELTDEEVGVVPAPAVPDGALFNW